MTDITIPPEVEEAGARRIYETWRDRDGTQLLPPWEWLAAEYRQTWLDQARAACLAMLEAWPGFHIGAKATIAPYIILPLPQEKPDAEA